MSVTPSDLFTGRLLDGRYLVEDRIARGGMAIVYRARDTRLDRLVALKVMNPELARDEEFVARFVTEARSAASLSHPGVVAVHDQGTDGNDLYLVMEYLSGWTLRDLVNAGPLGVERVFAVLEPVLRALSAAHTAGLIHRDIKPENILIGEDGRTKVADFGLARLVTAANQTKTGQLLGTVSYLAPEQIEHGHSDQRSDVYAVGIMLYEMLTGAKPYGAENPLSVLYQHVHSDVPKPSARVPDVPHQLDLLVAEATCRDPEGRPADAGALLARALQLRSELDGTFDQASGAVLVAESIAAATTVVPKPGPTTLLSRRRTVEGRSRAEGAGPVRPRRRTGLLGRVARWPFRPVTAGFRWAHRSWRRALLVGLSAGVVLASLMVVNTVLAERVAERQRNYEISRDAARGSGTLSSEVLATELSVKFGELDVFPDPDNRRQSRFRLPVTVRNTSYQARAFRFTVRTWRGDGSDPQPTETVVTKVLEPDATQQLYVFENLQERDAKARAQLLSKARNGSFLAVQAASFAPGEDPGSAPAG